jgi:3-oxoacyl-[acyl-carrier protein] reductase
MAIVTGGSKGIGRRVSELLRDAGAKVMVWDLLPPDFEGVTFAEVNVADRGSITRAVSTLTEVGSPVDILVNNAGFAGPSTPVLQFEPDAWRAIIEVNLVSVRTWCRGRGSPRSPPGR